MVSRAGVQFEELPPGAVVGTGSQRRRSQLLHARPDLLMKDVRGNVETRPRKLRDGDYDALVLAEAGLTRLGLATEITQLLPKTLVLPAVGQGALGLECRADDTVTKGAIALRDHNETHQAVVAERAMLRTLLGGCLAPVAAWGRAEANGQLQLSAVVLSADGRQRLFAERSDLQANAAELGRQVEKDVTGQGAKELLRAARSG